MKKFKLYIVSLVDKVIYPAVQIIFIFRYLQSSYSFSNEVTTFLGFVFPALLALFLLFSKLPKEVRLTPLAVFGLVLSHLLLFVNFDVTSLQLSGLVSAVGKYIVIGFFVLLLVAYLNLGRSLGIFPSLKPIKEGGFYNFIRHPIYSFWIHAFLSMVALNFTLQNFLLVVGVGAGLFIRAFEEERVLSKSENYLKYKGRVKKRFFHSALAVPVLFLYGALVYSVLD